MTMSKRIPVIGLTASSGTATLHANAGNYRVLMCETGYLDAVRSAGALPVVLTPDLRDVAPVVQLIDGLLLTGGPDISPRLYGESNESRTGPADTERDDFEFGLVHAAMAAELPVLGICRGLQMINVALGGSLAQHVDGHERVVQPSAADQRATIVRDSALHRILGVTQIGINSLHHQAIDRLADDLNATAFAPDGVLEAVGHARAMVLGVQWHPEKLHDHASVNALAKWLATESNSRQRATGNSDLAEEDEACTCTYTR